MSFPKLYRALAHADALCFFDVEASQYRMELLSLGMVLVKKERHTLSLSSDGIQKLYFVLKPEHKVRIGKKVEEITKLSQDDLECGIERETAEEKIRLLLSPYERVAFVSYGEMDRPVFRKSLFPDRDPALFDRIRFFDFHDYLSKNLVRKKGGSFSLACLMEIFSLPDNSVQFHNPLDDSICLYKIFAYYVSHQEEIRMMVRENCKVNPRLRSCLSYPETDLQKGIFKNL